MDTAKVAIRQTCDNCASSKVRCDGGQPCKRCSRRGQVCFYRPKKRRTKVIGEEKFRLAPEHAQQHHLLGGNSSSAKAAALTSSSASAAADPGFKTLLPNNVLNGNVNLAENAPKSLNEYERRTWSVFFTLFRNFNSSCSAFWFSFQLRKMLAFLEQAHNEAARKRFQSWLDALNIVPANSEADMQKCMQVMNSIRFQFLRPKEGVPVTVKASVTGYDIEAEAASSRLASIRVDTTGVCTTNAEFEEMFSISGKELTKMLSEAGGGLLPWGGDVVARIMPKESDIIAFIQILAIQLNSLGRPTVIPCIREVPTVHIMTCVTKDNRTYTCMVKSLHREIISELDFNSVRMEFFMSFAPMSEPISHDKVQVPASIRLTGKEEDYLASGGKGKNGLDKAATSMEELQNGELEVEDAEDMRMHSSSASGTPMESSASTPGAGDVSALGGDNGIEAIDLLPTDYFGDDALWLDEMIAWAGVPTNNAGEHHEMHGITTGEGLSSPDMYDLLPVTDSTVRER